MASQTAAETLSRQPSAVSPRLVGAVSQPSAISRQPSAVSSQRGSAAPRMGKRRGTASVRDLRQRVDGGLWLGVSSHENTAPMDRLDDSNLKLGLADRGRRDSRHSSRHVPRTPSPLRCCPASSPRRPQTAADLTGSAQSSSKKFRLS